LTKNLLDELISKPQREVAGSDSSSRFDYQRNWAFCEMLRRHMNEADYLVAFEFHDDTVFLSPSESPTNAEFYQVKTAKSTSPRKLADFTARPKKASSILGKMFANFDGICSSHAVSVIAVSNVPFEFSDKDISAKDLPETFRNRILTKLKAEIPSLPDDRINQLHFVITGVSIDAIQSFLNGEAMELFRSEFGEDHGLNVHSWVRLIQSEIVRKNNYASDKVTSIEELISKKCIARQAVENSLTIVSGKRKLAPNMGIVNAELATNGWSSRDLMRLSKAMPQATSDYVDSTNLEAAKLVTMLEDLLNELGTGEALSAFIKNAEQVLLPKLSSPYNDRLYLAALCVVTFHETI
jgi:hypothetical protein